MRALGTQCLSYITLIPHCHYNAKWQPQKNSPCRVSSGSFLGCVIIRLDQMVMSQGMLTDRCFLIIPARLLNSKWTNWL